MSTLAAETIARIDQELALEDLARLAPAERIETAAWAEAVHYERFHGPRKGWGIYTCHIFCGPEPAQGWAEHFAEQGRRAQMSAEAARLREHDRDRDRCLGARDGGRDG